MLTMAMGRLRRCSSAFSLLHKTAQITPSNILHVCPNTAVVRDTKPAVDSLRLYTTERVGYVLNCVVYISSSYSICFSVLRHYCT